MLLELSDSAIIPYNLTRLPEALKATLVSFKANNITKQLNEGGASLMFVESAINDLEKATNEYINMLADESSNLSPVRLRILNDQIMQLPRVFNMPSGIPGRPLIRNALFAPGKFNTYGSSALPGITDLLHEINDLETTAKEQRWEEIKRHLSDLMIMIQEAARYLKPVEDI
jgi:hypothetical protein